MCTDHTHFYFIFIKKKRHTNSKITEVPFLFYVITVLSFVYFSFTIFLGWFQGHTSQSRPVSVGVPRPVRVHIPGLVGVGHSWTSLESSELYFCMQFFLMT